MYIRVALTACAVFVSSVFISVPAHAAGRTINFSGHTWSVKSGYYGPGPNYWTDHTDDVYVDGSGALHLKVVQRDGAWRSSEVWLPASLGYGTYEFDIATRVDQLDPQVVAAPFLYQDDTHEIDIEYSRWGYAENKNTWYNIQPWYVSGNQMKYNTAQGGGPITARIEWAADRIVLSTLQNGVPLSSWIYTGANNFSPGKERVHINFWMYEAKAPQSSAAQELIVNAFRFAPLQTVTNSVTSLSETTVAPVAPQKQKIHRRHVRRKK